MYSTVKLKKTFQNIRKTFTYGTYDQGMKSIAERLKSKREEFGLTQALLAKKINVTGSSISQWERGETSPKGNNLLNLCEVFICSPEWLTEGTESKVLNDNLINIPFYSDVNAAAGMGRCVIDEFKEELWIAKKQLKYNVLGGLCAIYVCGDSMEPVLNDGSIIVIDTHLESICDGRMYVIRQDNLLRVKILSNEIYGIRVRSYNTNYPDEKYEKSKLKLNEIEILGKVIWHSSSYS